MAWRESGNNPGVKYFKDDVAAEEFITTRHLPEGTQQAIFHTRFATQGSYRDTVNNHPVIHGTIAGVHNGMVSNDNTLFQDLQVERTAEVDSEAIFAAIAHTEDVDEALGTIHGSAAIAWLDTRDEILNFARIRSNPIVMGVSTNGTVVFASTAQGVTEAFLYGPMTLAETYTLKDGDRFALSPDISRETFEPCPHGRGWAHDSYCFIPPTPKVKPQKVIETTATDRATDTDTYEPFDDIPEDDDSTSNGVRVLEGGVQSCPRMGCEGEPFDPIFDHCDKCGWPWTGQGFDPDDDEDSLIDDDNPDKETCIGDLDRIVYGEGVYDGSICPIEIETSETDTSCTRCYRCETHYHKFYLDETQNPEWVLQFVGDDALDGFEADCD